MSWSVIALNKNIENGYAVVSVEFTDGVKTVNDTWKSNCPTSSSFNDWCKGKISQLNSVDDAISLIKTGSVTIEEKIISDEEKLTIVFFNNLRILKSMMQAVNLGIINSNDKRLLDQIEILSTTVLDKYFSDPRWG